MKSRYLFRLFPVAANILVTFLATSIVLTTVSLQTSTPFVNDILFYNIPLIGGKVPSVVLVKLLLFTIVPTSFIGCAVILDKTLYSTSEFAYVVYAFQFALGIGLYSMEHQAESRSDLELELVESIMQYNEDLNIDDSLKWEATHIHLECCGFDNYQDWFVTPNGNRTDVPDSCCISTLYQRGCGQNAHKFDKVEEKIYVKGCYPIISRKIEIITYLYLGIMYILLFMPFVMFITGIRSWIIVRRRLQD